MAALHLMDPDVDEASNEAGESASSFTAAP